MILTALCRPREFLLFGGGLFWHLGTNRHSILARPPAMKIFHRILTVLGFKKRTQLLPVFPFGMVFVQMGLPVHRASTTKHSDFAASRVLTQAECEVFQHIPRGKDALTGFANPEEPLHEKRPDLHRSAHAVIRRHITIPAIVSCNVRVARVL